jgi:hypothetical protein
VDGNRGRGLALRHGDSCHACDTGAAPNHVVAIGNLIASVGLAAIMTGCGVAAVMLHTRMHVGLSIGLHHVADTRLYRLGRDREHQNDCQQFHALSLINYCG